jgi:hypothetical protein
MKLRLPRLILTLGILVTQTTSFAQSAMQSINGWNMEEKNGSYIFRPEKIAGETKEFSYEVMPVTKATGVTFDEWFNYAIDKDLTAAGLVLPSPKKNITSNQKIFSFSSEVKDKVGKTWFVTYVSYQTPDSEYRLGRAISSPDIKFYASNMRPAASHFGLLAKQGGPLGAVAKNTYMAPEPAKEEDHPFALNGDASAKALKSADIKGVLIHLGTATAADGTAIRVYSPYLVLNDGSIYADPVLSPYNFNHELSKAKEPWKWGTWKMKGETIVVNWPSRNESERFNKNWFWASPAAAAERIEGSYITRTNKDNESLMPGAPAGTLKNISLNKSGQFTITSLTDAAASSSDFTKKNEAGTYTLNEYSIELHFNNGTTLRRAFYFYLQGKTNFGVGSMVYVPKR